MQLFSILLIASSLVVSAFATPLAIVPRDISERDTAGSGGAFPGTHTGEGTWYGPGEGACGITNSNSDLIVAVSHSLFDSYPGQDGSNPNTNPVCGKNITATYMGKSVTVTVTDRCTGCDMYDLDFSPGAFGYLSSLSAGRLYGMTWTWA